MTPLSHRCHGSFGNTSRRRSLNGCPTAKAIAHTRSRPGRITASGQNCLGWRPGTSGERSRHFRSWDRSKRGVSNTDDRQANPDIRRSSLESLGHLKNSREVRPALRIQPPSSTPQHAIVELLFIPLEAGEKVTLSRDNRSERLRAIGKLLENIVTVGGAALLKDKEL